MKNAKMVTFTFLAILIIGCASTGRNIGHISEEIIQVEPLDIGDEFKQLNLICYENQNRLRSKTIYVQYYDETIKKRITKTVVSDTSGIGRIAIPAADDGASTVFRFSLDEATLNLITAIRIPPISQYDKSGQKTINLKFDIDMRLENGGPIQFMRFPAEGSNVRGGGDILMGGSSWRLKR